MRSWLSASLAFGWLGGCGSDCTMIREEVAFDQPTSLGQLPEEHWGDWRSFSVRVDPLGPPLSDLHIEVDTNGFYGTSFRYEGSCQEVPSVSAFAPARVEPLGAAGIAGFELNVEDDAICCGVSSPGAREYFYVAGIELSVPPDDPVTRWFQQILDSHGISSPVSDVIASVNLQDQTLQYDVGYLSGGIRRSVHHLQEPALLRPATVETN